MDIFGNFGKLDDNKLQMLSDNAGLSKETVERIREKRNKLLEASAAQASSEKESEDLDAEAADIEALKLNLQDNIKKAMSPGWFSKGLSEKEASQKYTPEADEIALKEQALEDKLMSKRGAAQVVPASFSNPTEQVSEVPVNPLVSAMNVGMDGIGMQSKAAEEEGRAVSNLYMRQARDMQAASDAGLFVNQKKQADIEDKMNALYQEHDALSKEKIDPDRYWNNKSTGNKVLAVLGAALSGYNHSNSGVELIQNAIKNDIATQEANLSGRKQSVNQRIGVLERLKDFYKDDQAAKIANFNLKLKAAELMVNSYQAKYGAMDKQGKLAQIGADLQMKIAQSDQMLRNRLDATSGAGGDVQSILSMVPEKLQAKAVEELGAVKSWSALQTDILSELAKLNDTSALQATIPSAFGGGGESYNAAKGKIAGAVIGKVPGIKSDSDFRNIIEPMLPKATETRAEAEKKLEIFKSWLKAQGPQAPILDSFGLRPEDKAGQMKRLNITTKK